MSLGQVFYVIMTFGFPEISIQHAYSYRPKSPKTNRPYGKRCTFRFLHQRVLRIRTYTQGCQLLKVAWREEQKHEKKKKKTYFDILQFF